MKTYGEKSTRPGRSWQASVGYNLKAFAVAVIVNLDEGKYTSEIDAGPFFVSLEWGIA